MVDQIRGSTELSDIYRERMNVQLGYACLEHLYLIPKQLKMPSKTDYPTTDDEDDTNFTIKIPDLKDLINEFERDDEYLYRTHERNQEFINEIKFKGFDVDPLWHIEDKVKSAKTALD